MATRRLQVEITGDSKGVSRAFKKTEGDATSLQSRLAGIAKKLGPLLAGGALAVTAAVGVGLVQAHGAAVESLKIARETERVVQSTGGAANVTADHIASYSSDLSHLVGVDDELIQSNANLLTTFTKVRNEVGEGNDVWDQGVSIALDMATVLKTDMKAATIQVGKALNDPIKGITALSRAGVSFTEQQKEQIRALVESGDQLGAQKIILAELNKEFGGAAAAAATPLDRLKVALGNVQEEIGAALIPIVDDAANWIGDKLPDAIAWAHNTVDRFQPSLERLRDWLGDVGDTVWDTVVPAWEDLYGAGQNLWEILQEIGDTVGPTAKLLGTLGGAAILGSIRGLAAGLEGLTGFLARNEGLIRLLIVAVATWAAMRAWALIVTAIETIYIKWLLLQSSVTGTAIVKGLSMIGGGFLAMGTNAAVGAGMVRGGMSSIASAVNPATAGLAAVIGFGVVLYQQFKDAGQAAEEWRSEVEKGIDASSLRSYVDAMAEGRKEFERSSEEADRLGIRGGSFWVRWQAGAKGVAQLLTPMENDIAEAAHGVHTSAEATKEWAARMTVLKGTYQALLDEIGSDPSSVLNPFAQMENWIGRLNLDPATMSVQEMGTAISEARLRAEEGTPATDDLAEAYGTLSDETSSATDQLDAWKQAMDAVMGVHINYEEALVGYRQGLADLTEKVKENGATLDINTQKGRDNRLELSGLASDAIDMALAFAKADGDVEGATAQLMANRDSLINAGVAAGFSRGEMEDYLASLRMTPDKIRTAIELEGIASAEKQIEHTTRQRKLGVVAAAITGRAESDLRWLVRERQVPIRLHVVNPSAAEPRLAQWGGMARGGPVTGGIPNRDSVPIMAMPGEFFIQKSAAKKIGMANLMAMNRGHMPLSSSGSVGSTSSAGSMSPRGGNTYLQVDVRVDGSVLTSGDDLARVVRDGLLRAQRQSSRPILPGVA